MRTIVLITLFIVITSALELREERSAKDKNLVDILTSYSNHVSDEKTREKRQFGGKYLA